MDRHPSTAVGIEYLPEDEESGFEGTVEHLAHKGVLPGEVDEVFWNGPVWLRNKGNRRAQWRMLGRSNGGRALDCKMMWSPSGDMLIPVTAWDASDADQRRYL